MFSAGIALGVSFGGIIGFRYLANETANLCCVLLELPGAAIASPFGIEKDVPVAIINSLLYFAVLLTIISIFRRVILKRSKRAN